MAVGWGGAFPIGRDIGIYRNLTHRSILLILLNIDARFPNKHSPPRVVGLCIHRYRCWQIRLQARDHMHGGLGHQFPGDKLRLARGGAGRRHVREHLRRELLAGGRVRRVARTLLRRNAKKPGVFQRDSAGQGRLTGLRGAESDRLAASDYYGRGQGTCSTAPSYSTVV